MCLWSDHWWFSNNLSFITESPRGLIRKCQSKSFLFFRPTDSSPGGFQEQSRLRRARMSREAEALPESLVRLWFGGGSPWVEWLGSGLPSTERLRIFFRTNLYLVANKRFLPCSRLNRQEPPECGILKKWPKFSLWVDITSGLEYLRWIVLTVVGNGYDIAPAGLWKELR